MNSRSSENLSTFPDFINVFSGPEQKELLPLMPVNVPYLLSEIVVAILAVVGNALTLFVFATDRKLRRLTNYYIASLALADLLVGVLGVPFAILTSLGLPRPVWACLLMLSSLIILCTISIFCLVAVSVDRYWAILYPLVYSRVMTGKIARRIIFACWCVGTIIGLLPVFGWHSEGHRGLCIFTEIVDYDYLVFLYFLTIVGPGIIMAVFYAHIYSVVLKQAKLSVRSEHGTLRQIASQEVPTEPDKSVSPATPKPPLSKLSSRQRFSIKLRTIGSLRESFRGIRSSLSRRKHASEDLEMAGQTSKTFSTKSSSMKAPQGSEYCRRDSAGSLVGSQLSRPSRREVKAAKNLSIIVLFFFICWFPLYTINCVQAFCQNCPVPGELMFFLIILSHANSAINPILYAYHMKDFRRGLEVHILKRLGWRSSKSTYYGAPLSPHYSTIMQVTPNATLPRSRSPYLCNASSFDPSPSPLRSLLSPMEDMSPTYLGCHSGDQDGRSYSDKRRRKAFLESYMSQKRALNVTSSWPPSLFSRMLLSPKLLSADSSSHSRSRKRKLRKFLSLDFDPHRQQHFSLSSSLVEVQDSSSQTIDQKIASLISLASSCTSEYNEECLGRHRKSFSEPSSPNPTRPIILSLFAEFPNCPPYSKSESSSISSDLCHLEGEPRVQKPKKFTPVELGIAGIGAAETKKHKSSSRSNGHERTRSDQEIGFTNANFSLNLSLLERAATNSSAAWNIPNNEPSVSTLNGPTDKLSKSTNSLPFGTYSSQCRNDTPNNNIDLETDRDAIKFLNNNFKYLALTLSPQELQNNFYCNNISHLPELQLKFQKPDVPHSSSQHRKCSENEISISKHPTTKRTLSDGGVFNI